MDFENPEIYFDLYQSASIEVAFSGKLKGTNSTQTRELDIPSTTLKNGMNRVTIDKTELRNFLAGFSGKFPDTFTFYGTSVVNPDYLQGSIANTDSVRGTAYVEFPMKIGILDGTIKDSVKVDLTNDDRDKLNSVGDGTIVLEITNGLAAETQFRGSLYVPPLHAPNDSLITVGAAQINSNGEVTSPTTAKVSISLTADEVQKFKESKYVKSNIVFSTQGNGTTPVAIRVTDPISVKAYGTFNYKVESK